MGYRTVEVPESRVVIVEGIYALNTRLRPQLDLRVSITGGVHFDLVKRVLRDINRSGQAPEEIIQQVGVWWGWASSWGGWVVQGYMGGWAGAPPACLRCTSCCRALVPPLTACTACPLLPALYRLPVPQISETVYPMYKAFIEPDLKAAHLRIYNTFNPFSGFMSPTYILKSASAITKAAVCGVLKVRRPVCTRHVVCSDWVGSCCG